MNTNQIEKIRAEVREYFDVGGAIADSSETHISPSGHYRLATQTFKQKRPDRNWEVTRVEVFEIANGLRLYEFIATYNRFFFTWMTVGGNEMLICAEDLFGGQTVIDLVNRRMSSYSPDMDGFIWTEHFLSPDEKHLAVSGCIWGAPYWVNVYDFSSPHELPLPLVKEIGIDDEGDVFGGWVDNMTVRMITPEKKERLVRLND